MARLNELLTQVIVNGEPVLSGYVYIGLPNQNAVTNPKSAFSTPDFQAGTEVDNPLRTNAQGYLTSQGTKTAVYIQGDFSITYQQEDTTLIDSFLFVPDETATGSIGIFNYPTATGSGNAISLTYPITEYTTDNVYPFISLAENTGSVTVDIDSIGVTDIVLPDESTPLTGAEILAGEIYWLQYNGTDFVVLNPAVVLESGANIKNFVIDPAMDYWPEGTSFLNAADGQFGSSMFSYADRVGGTGKVTLSQDSGFSLATNFVSKLNVTTIDAAPAATDVYGLQHAIEGYDFTGLATGPFVVSFKVKASKAGTYCVAVQNSGRDKSFVSEFTINAADTVETKIINVTTPPSTGTWDYTNGVGIRVTLVAAAGANFQTVTPGEWVDGDKLSTSNQVNFMDSVLNNLSLGEVIIGKQSSPFNRPLIAETMKDVTRYYVKSYETDTVPGTAVKPGYVLHYTQTFAVGAPNPFITIKLDRMRVAPTVTIYSTSTGATGMIERSGVGDIASTAADIGDSGFSVLGALSSSSLYLWQYTAEARLT